MVNIVPVDRERHSGKGCRWGAGFNFVAEQAIVPLVGFEFAHAAVAMPIAFVKHSERYVPVAVMSPVQGRNMFVGPSGQWLGMYLPALLRTYPFRLAQFEGREGLTVCVDEDSGWVVDADGHAFKFFEDDGTPSATFKGVIEFLQYVEKNRVATNVTIAALCEAHLLQPWPLTVTIGGQQVTANGLYRIDEAALNGLDEESFLKLRKSSALVLAYSQLISSHTTVVFEQIARLQQQLTERAKPLPKVSSLFPTDDGGTIRFN